MAFAGGRVRPEKENAMVRIPRHHGRRAHPQADRTAGRARVRKRPARTPMPRPGTPGARIPPRKCSRLHDRPAQRAPRRHEAPGDGLRQRPVIRGGLLKVVGFQGVCVFGKHNDQPP